MNSTGSLFNRIIQVESLTQAWYKCRANGGSAGGDGQTIRQFNRSSALRLARLSLELKQGIYRPGPLRFVDIPKNSGGTRRLSIPCIVDRVVQSSAAAQLTPLLEPEFEPSSYGYRPGRSVKAAIEKISSLHSEGFEWVVDADIRAFFDSVSHELLLNQLSHYTDGATLELVSLWLESFSDDGLGLAQGSPISPILSNLYLDYIDESFSSEQIRLVRFADDFVLLAKTQKVAERAMKRAVKQLGELGLELNLEKTQIVSFEQSFKFLGKLFVRSMVIDANDGPHHRPTQFKDDLLLEERMTKSKPLTADALAPFIGEDSDKNLSPGFVPLYVLDPGLHVAVTDESFRILRDNRELVTIPARQVGRMELGAYVEASDRALRLASANRIPVVFLDGYQQPEATLECLVPDRGQVHLSQAALILNEDERVKLAKTLVDGRIRNQYNLLKRLRRNINEEEKLAIIEESCEAMATLRTRVSRARTVNQSLGYEGNAARYYWPALGATLKHGWTFNKRIRKRPTDAINAVLNWTSSLLTREIKTAVLKAGLHPGFGVLHTPDDRHDACVYDLVEEFRAPIAEALTIYLFNNRIITQNDVTQYNRQTKIGAQAGSRLIKTYESWLARTLIGPDGLRTSWRQRYLLQARALRVSFEEKSAYKAFKIDY